LDIRIALFSLATALVAAGANGATVDEFEKAAAAVPRWK
jgi:hypothetical protein